MAFPRRSEGHRNTNSSRPLPEGKVRRYVHSPFSFEHQGVLISCDKDGKITLKKADPDDPEVYDEIEVQASLIIRLTNMLRDTRKIVHIDKEDIPKEEPVKG